MKMVYKCRLCGKIVDSKDIPVVPGIPVSPLLIFAKQILDGKSEDLYDALSHISEHDLSVLLKCGDHIGIFDIVGVKE